MSYEPEDEHRECKEYIEELKNQVAQLRSSERDGVAVLANAFNRVKAVEAENARWISEANHDRELYCNLHQKYSALEIALSDAEKVMSLVDGSFEAAEGEGLTEAIQNTQDERLKDLLCRRILHHREDLREVLAAVRKLRGGKDE
jgi:predicted nuclease with TOPRIM domain